MTWAPSLIARIRQQVGRRGQALLVFAFVDAVLSYSLLDSTSRGQTAALPQYRAMQELLPLAAWGWLWAGVGLVCALSAFARQDAPGFVAAIGIKVVWTLGFFLSWVIYDAPRAWIGAATWLVVARLVALIAGWPEPLAVEVPERPR